MTTPDELAQARAEIERLKQENEQLRTGAAPTAAHRAGWVRSTGVVVLMVLGFLLVPTAGVAVWTRNTLLDTERYVETVAPLAESPAVVDDVAEAITDAIFERVDLEALLAEELPPRLAFAAGPITGQVRSTTKDVVVRALESDQFKVLWQAINRQASSSVVAFVTRTEQSQVLSIKNGKLLLDLAPVIEEVKTRLAEEGLDFAESLPAISQTVEMPIADVELIVQAREGVKLLDTLAWVLPLLAVLCFAGAVLLSRNRRRSLVTVGLSVAGAALLVGLSLTLLRAGYLTSMAETQVSQETAAVVYDTMIRFLRNGVRVFFLLGLVLAFAAAVTGPAGWAVGLRRSTGNLLTSGGERSNLNTGPVGTFLDAHRTGYRIATVVLFGVILIGLDLPTPASVLWLVVGSLVVLALLEFLAATGRRAPEESSPLVDVKTPV